MSEPQPHPSTLDPTAVDAASLLRESLLADGSALSRPWVAAEMFEYDGELDLTALQNAADALIARHQALRDTFHHGGDGWEQRIRRPRPAVVHHVTEGSHVCLEPFDMSVGPFLRVILESRVDHAPLLCLEVAHFVADGLSLSTLFDELGQLYGAFARQEQPQLPAVPQPGDFARHQRKELTPARREQICGDWAAKLRGSIIPVFDRPRSPDAAPDTGVITRALEPTLLRSLRAAARQHDTTLPILAFHCYTRALATVTGHHEVVFDTPFSGRGGSYTRLVDNLANVMPLRLRADLPLSESLAAIREQLLAATESELLPFHEVEAALDGRLDPSTDLSQMSFFSVWQHSVLRLPGLRVKPAPHRPQGNALALQSCSTFLQLDEHEGRVVSVFDRNCAEPTTVESLLDVLIETAHGLARESGGGASAAHHDVPTTPPNPFESAQDDFVVLVNADRQFSLWPARLAVPTGWTVEHGGDRAACLSYVDDAWQDMRPVRLIAGATPANGAHHGNR